MDDLTPVPAAPSTDERISSFWQEHGSVLTDPAHVDQQRRNDELTRLYHEKTGEPLPQDAPEPSLADFAETPVASPDEYDIGPRSRFGMNVGPVDGWDEQTETQARQWMAAAGMSQSSAQVVAGAYVELGKNYYNSDRAAVQSQELIGKAYPGEADAAVAAMRRVIMESGGESLKAWLNETGLGNHPLVVHEVMTLAERKGYIARKGA